MNKENKTQFLTQYKMIQQALDRYCRAISGNREEAKDLLGDTILVLLEKWENIRDKGAFRTYAFSVASNLHKMKLRRKKFIGQFEEAEIDHISDKSKNPEDLTELSLIYDCILKLPKKMSEALILFHLADLSLEDIRKIQGGSLSGVKQRLKRGREKLIKNLNTPVRSKLILLILSL